MPSALFVSPHLDDVAFSCGGTMRRLADAGWRTVLCTVFTRSVPNPQGFALACQLDKGLGPEVDYMALRRAEDSEAARHLSADEVLWLDLPEAPHRGYGSAAALFGPLPREDAIGGALDAALAPELAAHDLVVGPQAIGAHVDHRHVRDSLLRLSAGAIAWYRDTPYAIRHPQARPATSGEGALSEIAVALGSASLRAKLDACAAYATQLGFQFGGEPEMRAALSGFATAEAARLGRPGVAAETLLASIEACDRLAGDPCTCGAGSL